MPTYGFSCPKCKQSVTILSSIKVELLVPKCYPCGGIDMNRQYGSGPGLSFKGSGFYSNDKLRG